MSTVYKIDLSGSPERNIIQKFDDALSIVMGEDTVRKNSLVAVKVHFGEKGNLAFVRHQFSHRIVERIKNAGGKPFLTDTNTLYVGSRSCAPDHIMTALMNGFGPLATGAPVIIGDGLRGLSSVPVEVKGEYVEEAVMGAELINADSLFVVTHFKGHELTGFGGSIKNLGMGCAAREGKLFQHSTVSPIVDPTGCIACERCVAVCPGGAISIVDERALIDPATCIGCADCIVICPEQTINVDWNEATEAVMRKMSEYALAAVKGKGGRTVFTSFLTQISPLCDCYGFSDTPIAPDIGILMSKDPIAIDQASVDLVIDSMGGEDPFKKTHPHIDWEIQLDHGEKVGLGSRNYDLISVD